MKCFLILLFSLQANAISDINELEKKTIWEKLKSVPEINNLKNKIKDNVKIEMLDHSVKIIAEQTLIKIKNTNSKDIILKAESQANYWGNCLYKVFKNDGVKAAQAAQDVVINNGQKKNIQIQISQFLKIEEIKNQSDNFTDCFSKIGK